MRYVVEKRKICKRFEVGKFERSRNYGTEYGGIVFTEWQYGKSQTVRTRLKRRIAIAAEDVAFAIVEKSVICIVTKRGERLVAIFENADIDAAKGR